MNNLKKIFLLAVTSIFITLAGCSSHEEVQETSKMPPITVQTKTIAGSTQVNMFSVSGNIQPKKEVNISTRMMGYITNINVDVGNYVSKGKVLINISNVDLQAKLAQTKANIRQAEVGLQNAKKDYDRLTVLFSQNSVTQKELDDITTHYNMAKAGLDAARQMENEVNAQFQYSRITAPFSGTVTAKFANEGDMANPGMPLLTLAQSGQFQAVVMVPENKISQLKVGQKANVWVKALGVEITGKVEEVGISSKNTGGQFIVKLNLDKHEHKIYAGMYTTVSFENKESNDLKTILVPAESIVQIGGLKGVYTVSIENNAILRWLRIGKKYGSNYEVLSGLSNGEQVIISSSSRLYNGAPLTIQ